MASTIKTLRVLILLDEKGWISAAHISKILHMTPHEGASHLRMLQRVGLVDNQPSRKIQGTRTGTIYSSIRTQDQTR